MTEVSVGRSAAVGVQANIEGIGLEELGIKTEKGKIIKTPLTRGPCALCASIATHSGANVETLAPGRGRTHHKRRRQMPDGRRIPEPSWACKICKVRLCRKVCFARWNHEDNGPPLDRELVLA